MIKIENTEQNLNALTKSLNTFFSNFDYFIFINNVFKTFEIFMSYPTNNEFEHIKNYFKYISIIKIFKLEYKHFKIFILIYLEDNKYKYKIFSFTNLNLDFDFSIENEGYFHETSELVQLENKEFEDSYHISYAKDIPIVKIMEIFNIYVQEGLHDLWKSNAFINKIYKDNNLLFFDESFLNFYEKTDYFNLLKIDELHFFNSASDYNDIDNIISKIILDANWFFENIIKIFMHLILFEKWVVDFNFNNYMFNINYENIICNSPLYLFCKFYWKDKIIYNIVPHFNEQNNYVILKLDVKFSEFDSTIETVRNEIINNHPMCCLINAMIENQNLLSNATETSSNTKNSFYRLIDNQVIIKFNNNLPNFIISRSIPKFQDIYDFENKKQIWMNNIHIFSHNLKNFLNYEFIDKYANLILKLEEIAINENVTFINYDGYLFILTLKNNIYVTKKLITWLLSFKNI